MSGQTPVLWPLDIFTQLTVRPSSPGWRTHTSIKPGRSMAGCAVAGPGQADRPTSPCNPSDAGVSGVGGYGLEDRG